MKLHLIEVTPARQQNGNITWTMCYNNDCKGAPAYVDVTLQKNSGQHVFMVSLNDEADLGVSFPKTFGEAIWIQEGAKPKKAPAGASNQIIDTQRANKSTLVFTDKNDKAVDLHYQLNFVGAPPIDPAIRNGGGTGGVPPPAPPPLIGTETAIALLIGFVVGAVLAGVLFRRAAARNRVS